MPVTCAVYLGDDDSSEEWSDMLGAALPEGWRSLPFDRVERAEEVDYAVVWQPRTGALAQFGNLRAIVSIGAGIDHVLADAELPKDTAIIRTVGPDLTQRMREYIALHVLRMHRLQPRLDRAQQNRDWDQITVPVAFGHRVGVMGLGNLGAAAATTLAALGFEVRGWSRSPRTIDGVTCHSGAGQLDDFLHGVETLVCLLPLTDATRDILDARTFSKLAPGAHVLNAARGEHLVEDDLLAALDSGQVAQATLDVFRTEPLPRDHAFWSHPAVTVTPHVASMIDTDTGISIIARNLTDFHAGRPVAAICDIERRY